MKTLELNGKVIRVKEELVNIHINKGWTFVPKSEFKTKVRDVKNEEPNIQTDIVVRKRNKKSKALSN